MEFEFTTMADVDSSWIHSVFYNAVRGEMAVRMHNGYTYAYLNVPVAVFENMRDSVSPGRFYNSSVKGSYKNIFGDGVYGMRFRQDETTKETVVAEQKTFTVRAFVPFEAQVEAESLEDAVRIFHETHSDVRGVTIKEIVVPFGE
jgi:hypothetical protein